MKNRVKITTLGWILDMFFPCYCRGCGKIGSAFCDRCIFNNMKNNPPFFTKKDKDFKMILACGMKIGVLSKMVSDYKYQSRRYYAEGLSKVMYETVRRLSPRIVARPEEYLLVPLPTIRKHIRSRGFDHILTLCKGFSAISGIQVCQVLCRANSAVQVGSDAKTRLEQAKGAYLINSKVKLEKKRHYILVDDVWTTGASMRAARGVLEAELIRLGVKKREIKISAICLVKNDGYDFN